MKVLFINPLQLSNTSLMSFLVSVLEAAALLINGGLKICGRNIPIAITVKINLV